jgi:hypothetical protein
VNKFCLILSIILARSRLNPTHGEVYSIQHYAIKFVSDLRQVCGFLRVLRFPQPIKLTATNQILLFNRRKLWCQEFAFIFRCKKVKISRKSDKDWLQENFFLASVILYVIYREIFQRGMKIIWGRNNIYFCF